MSNPLSELHEEFGAFSDCILTKKGTLILGLELEGQEPDGLSDSDFSVLSVIARNIYQKLPTNISVTQYFHHFKSNPIAFKNRKHKVCNLLSKKRESFLQEKHIYNTKLVHYFEITPDININKLDLKNFITHLMRVPFCEESKKIIFNHMSYEKKLLFKVSELKKIANQLKEAVNEVCLKWSSSFSTKKMSIKEMWLHNRFLSNLDSSKLQSKESVPEFEWDSLLAESAISEVNENGSAALKLHDIQPRYAKILAVTKFGQGNVKPGMWSYESSSPTRIDGDYVIMMRFAPLNKLQQHLLFNNKKSELQRRTISFDKLISGSKEKADLKPKIKSQLDELEQAELVEDTWGMSHAFIVSYSHDMKSLDKQCLAMKKSLNNSDFSICFEDIDLPFAWKTFLPGGKEHSIRDIPSNTSQFGACSLLYQSKFGQPEVKDLGNEEPQYVFLSSDKTPFYYNPFVGGRGMVFGIGPIRSGKSFIKNTLATHFLKYDGMYRALDIDPGTEPIAKIFGNDAGIFNIKDSGFNPFICANGPSDLAFANHLRHQIINMLQANDTEELRTLSKSEQKELDEAIVATLKLPKELHKLSTMVNHCSLELQSKMQRFTGDNLYGHLFDQSIDSLGNLEKMIGIFNLADIKNDRVALPLVMSEIFFRITRLFESEQYRQYPKMLDIDEAHILLKQPYIVDKITQFVRTWGKYKAGLSMWSQSPKEFLEIPDWPALKSAASTFFFMADPKMDETLYRKTFNLTSGECNAIKNLIPKKEAYIIQPELGVSKKIILEVEKEQYIISTSNPDEVYLRNKNISKFGLNTGIQKTIEELECF